MRPGQGRSSELHVGGRCELTCALCDCRAPASGPEAVDRVLGHGGGRLVLRGPVAANPSTAALVARARAAGFGEIVARTSGLAYREPRAAQGLRALGVDAVLVPLFSHAPAVHDRIAGRKESLVGALVGMRALADAGLAVEIEVPLLAPSLQRPEAVVELAHRAVPSLRAARFFLVRGEVPPPLSPPRWSEGASLLAAAIERSRALGVACVLGAQEAIPLCALADFAELHDAYRFNPKAKTSLAPGCALLSACEGCAARRQCPGVAPSYARAHGAADLRPYGSRPKLMYEQRTTRRPAWTPERRRAASKANLLVLRPTVNCNQDCTFCSANETSNNVWADPGEMLRAIARAGRRGVHRVAFSGGEPTLSRHLQSFIHAAHRCGIPEIELVTNAVLLDAPAKVRALRDAGLTHACVSLHAHDEEISRRLTQKVGDFERTVRAIGYLVDAGVTVVINHVVSYGNYRYLRRFVELVHERYGGRSMISFAFLTPQYKALEHLDLLPKLSEVMPYLRVALHRAVELGQVFVVGSRQGVPPCFLGEFRGWSDVIELVNEAHSEDQHQKQQGEACERCRYRRLCTGLWKPYAARFGFGELAPIAGEPFTDAELDAVRSTRRAPWGQPMGFDELAEPVRDRAAEAGYARDAADAMPAAAPPLPLFVPQRSRPVRLLLLGTGRQARRLAERARSLRDVSIDAVASPHALDHGAADFGHVPAYADAAEAMDDIRPEGVIVASATHSHVALARLALARRLPLLCEKPLAPSAAEAATLVEEARALGVPLMPAHNVLFAPGLAELWRACDGEGDARRFTYLRRCGAQSPDAPRLWSRAGLAETLYHALVLVGRGVGGGVGRVCAAHYQGEAAPLGLRLEVAYRSGVAELVIDFAAQSDELTLDLRPMGSGGVGWRRAGRSHQLLRDGAPTAIEGGNEIEAMLAAFRAVILGEGSPEPTAESAVDVLRTTHLAIEALEAAGAPFDRPNAPRHAASRAL